MRGDFGTMQWDKEDIKVDWQKLLPPARISGLTSPLGSNCSSFCLDLPYPQAEQGLQKTVLDRIKGAR
jgi:hypothetical protein